jgi:NADH-quinone oxidoreductase subunit L
VLTLLGGRLERRWIAAIANGCAFASAIVASISATAFLAQDIPREPLEQTLWTWIDTRDLTIRIGLRFDELAMVRCVVVAWVAALIHLYAARDMAEDSGYARFFTYLNLFLGAMLTLVLADDLLLLYLGWEGVGLSSYLLIGFWQTEEANVAAAEKAFVVTRIGDTAMLLGLILIAREIDGLDIASLLAEAPQTLAGRSGLANTIALLLLAGAVGKSAQVPLQTWLPDAMAGPTPVSALIHAATMVTAGVYLLARLDGFFALAPLGRSLAAWLGATTVVLGSLSALVERDVKRILAYSTMSQLGNMFAAVGAGAWPAGILHLVIHAFFKALLFLSAGVLILGAHHEQDITKLGVARKTEPIAAWTFVIGAASLAGLPLVTAGFYSKEWILASDWALGAHALFVVLVFGAFLTAMYSARAVFWLFQGNAEEPSLERRTDLLLNGPLVILAVLSLTGGLLEPGLSRLFGARGDQGGALQLWDEAAVLLGIAGAVWMGSRPKPSWLTRAEKLPAEGFGFDAIYQRLIVAPFLAIARAGRRDVIDLLYVNLGRACRAGYMVLSASETGRVRWYAAAIAGGAVVALALVRLA